MQNNWGNFSKVAYLARLKFFAVQRGAWPKCIAKW